VRNIHTETQTTRPCSASCCVDVNNADESKTACYTDQMLMIYQAIVVSQYQLLKIDIDIFKLK